MLPRLLIAAMANDNEDDDVGDVLEGGLIVVEVSLLVVDAVTGGIEVVVVVLGGDGRSSVDERRRFVDVLLDGVSCIIYYILYTWCIC